MFFMIKLVYIKLLTMLKNISIIFQIFRMRTTNQIKKINTAINGAMVAYNEEEV